MDNRYFNYQCPPLMNDGRFLTNYVRSSTFDQYIRITNGIENATDFRHYLQNNGDKILNNLKAYHHKNNSCSVNGRCLPISDPVIPIVKDTNIPIWYEDMLDNPKPQLDFMMYQPPINEPSVETDFSDEFINLTCMDQKQ